MKGGNMVKEIAGTFGTLAMIHNVISRLYADAIHQNMVEGLQSLDEKENLLLIPDDPDWTEGLGQIAAYCRGHNVEQKVLEATGDHSRLFVGPGHLLAPPWASVYLDTGTMYGPSTLKVADTYKRFGLTVPNPGTEPDDHIAFEMAFVAALYQKVQSEVEAGDFADAAENTEALSKFVNDHLSVWLTPFLSRIEEHAETEFYCGLAKVTRALAALDQRFISHLLSELKGALGTAN